MDSIHNNLALIGGASLLGGLCWKFCLPKKRSGLVRNISFNSKVMMNSFPPEAKVCQPMINIAYLFETLPETDEVVAAFSVMRDFDRMRCTLQKNGSSYEFHESAGFDIQKHIKTMTINSEKEMMAVVDKLASTELEDKDTQPLWYVRL